MHNTHIYLSIYTTVFHRLRSISRRRFRCLAIAFVAAEQRVLLLGLLPAKYRWGAWVGLYERFFCLFGDCALVNTILGVQHLLYCTPPLSILQSILRNI